MAASWRAEGRATNSAAPHAWSRFESELHAAEFSGFLGKLRLTSIYKNAESMPDVKLRVNHLLGQLEAPDRGALRALCFLEGNEVVRSCADGAAMALVRMETASRIAQVESDIRAGKYDDGAGVTDTTPATLWSLAKGMYRLQKLEEIAHQKTTLEGMGDTIEVHLGFLCQLAEKFALPIRMQTMLYYGTSQIKDADIANAIQVLQEDGAPWDEFLAAWGPLDALMQRQDPHGHAALGATIAHEVAIRKDALYKRCEAIGEAIDALDAGAPDRTARRAALEGELRTLGDRVNHLDAQVSAELKTPAIAAFGATHKINTRLSPGPVPRQD